MQLALGPDGAPCNNNRLATIDGARALGLDRTTGSLEAGKRADLAIVRLDAAHAEPGGDVFSRLVYACGARDVTDVMVDGAFVVRRREHQTVDVEAAVARARAEAKRLVARARI